jgi:prolyl-tRNA synthetase
VDRNFFLPALNPIELWEETGRVKAFGDTMFHIKNRPLVLAPTHEEVITSIARNHIKSYKDLPQIWYQIQTKFRNEPRPKSGVLRGRQFLMKDSYSLDSSWEGLDVSYDLHAPGIQEHLLPLRIEFFLSSEHRAVRWGEAVRRSLWWSPMQAKIRLRCATIAGMRQMLKLRTQVPQKRARLADNNSVEEIYTPNIKTIDELAKFLNVETRNDARNLLCTSARESRSSSL